MGDFSVHRNSIHQSPEKDGEETHRNSDLDPNVAKINRLPQGNSSLGRNTGFPHQNKNPRLPFSPHNFHRLPDSKNHRNQGPRTRKTRGSTSRPGRGLVTGVASPGQPFPVWFHSWRKDPFLQFSFSSRTYRHKNSRSGWEGKTRDFVIVLGVFFLILGMCSNITTVETI